MALSAQIAAISHVHENLLNWLLLNPDRSLRECADHFGFTQPWVSTIIHSDVFQAKLKNRQESVFARVAESIPQKLRAIGDMALDKLSDQLAASEDPDYILDVTDKVLHRMGYAPATARNSGAFGAQVAIQNNITVSVDDLTKAQGVMAQVGASFRSDEAHGKLSNELSSEVLGE